MTHIVHKLQRQILSKKKDFINRDYDPIGTGDGRKRPKTSRNAFLITRDMSGTTVKTPLWVTSISTDLDMKMNESQKKDGLTFHPERMQGRTLKINVVFPAYNNNLKPNKEIENLIDVIKDHWAYNLNDLAVPMKLNYFGINKTFKGFIEGIDAGASWDDVTIQKTLSMTIVKRIATNPASVRGSGPIVPTASDVRNKDKGDWYNINKLAGKNKNKKDRGNNNGGARETDSNKRSGR